MKVPIHSNWHILACTLFLFEFIDYIHHQGSKQSSWFSLVKLCVFLAHNFYKACFQSPLVVSYIRTEEKNGT
jgi:hypothetical protein